MGAARAKIGNSGDIGARAFERAFLILEKSEAFLDVLAGVKALDTVGDGARHAGRGQFASRRQYPFAGLVELSDDARAHVRAPVVKLFLELVLDDAALFLDYEHLVEAFGEAADALALQGPGHGHLVNPEPDLGGLCLVDTKVVERLHDVGIGFARGGDAEAGVGAVDDHLVEPVGAREGQRRIKLVALQPLFLLQRRVGESDMQAVRRHFEVLGHDDGCAAGVDKDGCRCVHGLGDGF